MPLKAPGILRCWTCQLYKYCESGGIFRRKYRSWFIVFCPGSKQCQNTGWDFHRDDCKHFNTLRPVWHWDAQDDPYSDVGSLPRADGRKIELELEALGESVGFTDKHLDHCVLRCHGSPSYAWQSLRR